MHHDFLPPKYRAGYKTTISLGSYPPLDADPGFLKIGVVWGGLVVLFRGSPGVAQGKLPIFGGL